MGRTDESRSPIAWSGFCHVCKDVTVGGGSRGAHRDARSHFFTPCGGPPRRPVKKKKRETGFRVWSREWGPALVPYGGRSTTGISENAALRTSRWWETFRTHLSLFKEKNYSTITAVGGRLVETGFWVWSSFSTTSPEYSSVSLLTVESDQRGAAFRTA